ncbi:CoA-binding protein [Blautia sp. RD014234]|nr:CoA-binding protein [Blautia parvula]
MDLRKLLKPRTVAIVGASEKAGFGGDTTRNYLKFSGNLDHLYLVNPGREEIFGHKAYHSLSEIEGDVDLVILCTPRRLYFPYYGKRQGRTAAEPWSLPADTVRRERRGKSFKESWSGKPTAWESRSWGRTVRGLPISLTVSLRLPFWWRNGTVPAISV